MINPTEPLDVDAALLKQLERLWSKLMMSTTNRLPCHLTSREAGVMLQAMNSLIKFWPGTAKIRKEVERFLK